MPGSHWRRIIVTVIVSVDKSSGSVSRNHVGCDRTGCEKWKNDVIGFVGMACKKWKNDVVGFVGRASRFHMVDAIATPVRHGDGPHRVLLYFGTPGSHCRRVDGDGLTKGIMRLGARCEQRTIVGTAATAKWSQTSNKPSAADRRQVGCEGMGILSEIRLL